MARLDINTRLIAPHIVKDTRGFAMLEALTALLVIGLAAATVPVVTVNARRRLEFNKRRFAAVMVRNNLINILSRDDNWYLTVKNQLAVGQPFACYGNPSPGYTLYIPGTPATGGNYAGCDAFQWAPPLAPNYFNPTPTKASSFAVYYNSGANAGAGTVYYDPRVASDATCSAGYNGFSDAGAPCCDAGTPDAACPIQVLFSWTMICGHNIGNCDPNLLNVKATFNIYSGDVSLSTQTALNSGGGLGGGKYEFDLVRPAPAY